MDVEMVVIGAGFWGTAITVQLRRAGHQVLCLDSGAPGYASRVAGGLVDPAWLRGASFTGFAPEWWVESCHQACEAFLNDGRKAGWAEPTGELVLPQKRLNPGLWCLDCERFLSQADAQSLEIKTLESSEKGWKVGPFTATWVIVACGWSTDLLLTRSGIAPLGVKRQEGRALLYQGDVSPSRPVTVNYRLPGESRTRKATARSWSQRRMRVGDSSGEGQLQRLQDLAAHLGDWQLQGEIWGFRPALPRLFVELYRPGLVVATGGWRVGLASAAAVAQRVGQIVEV